MAKFLQLHFPGFLSGKDLAAPVQSWVPSSPEIQLQMSEGLSNGADYRGTLERHILFRLTEMQSFSSCE